MNTLRRGEHIGGGRGEPCPTSHLVALHFSPQPPHHCNSNKLQPVHFPNTNTKTAKGIISTLNHIIITLSPAKTVQSICYMWWY